MNVPLRFTKNNDRLTLPQRLFYEENGYLLFPRLIPQDVLDKCHRRYPNANEPRKNNVKVEKEILKPKKRKKKERKFLRNIIYMKRYQEVIKM